MAALAGLTEPLPAPTAKVTVAPAAALPKESVACTVGLMATAVPTVALWLLPATSESSEAAPAEMLTAPEQAPASPALEAPR